MHAPPAMRGVLACWRAEGARGISSAKGDDASCESKGTEAGRYTETGMKPATKAALREAREEIEQAIAEDIAINGPILLWSGNGKMPANFRGLVPSTIEGYLTHVREWHQEKQKRAG
jgi:hypothetical protein